MGDERAKAIPLYLSWIGTLCGAFLVLLSDVFPVRLGFVRPDTLFVCLTEVEAAFVLFAWPVFIPSLGAGRARVSRLLPEAGVLLIAALPLELIAANVSNIGLFTFLRAQAVLAALAVFAAALLARGGQRGWRVGPWYVLGVFVLSSILPFLAVILAGSDLSWLAAFSPFWAAAKVDGGVSLGLAAIFGGAAAALLAAGAFFRKGGAA